MALPRRWRALTGGVAPAVLAALLAANAALHLMPDPDIEVAGAAGVKGRPAAPAMPAPAAFVLPDLAAFRVVTDRPAFTPSRRPPAPVPTVIAQANAAPPPPPPRLTLLGRIATGGIDRVIVRSATGPSRIAAPGDVIDGWRLTRILSDGIELDAQGQRAEVKLARRGGLQVPSGAPPKTRAGAMSRE